MRFDLLQVEGFLVSGHGSQVTWTLLVPSSVRYGTFAMSRDADTVRTFAVNWFHRWADSSSVAAGAQTTRFGRLAPFGCVSISLTFETAENIFDGVR